MPDSLYSLFLYILSCSDKEFDETFFVFGKLIPPSITSKFKHSYIFHENDKKGILSHKFFREVFYWRYVKWFILPCTKHINIYACDQYAYNAYVIGKNSYTLLEDAPHSNSYNDSTCLAEWDEARRSMKHYRLLTKFYGPIYGHCQGMNSQCTNLMMWKYDDTAFIRSKKVNLVDLAENWRNCSEIKRNFIYTLFDLTDADICNLKKRPIILLTQPLFKEIKHCHTIIYWMIAHKYPKDKLIIKTHPRDRFDYERILPDYYIFRKPVPFQLLSFMGIRYQKAVTLFSTSVLDFDYPIEVDWYGRGCDSFLPDLYKRFPVPSNVNLCYLDL